MAFDAIVIGSGFGGAICACRLGEAGYKVLILERGRRWDKSNFPRGPEDQWLWNAEQPEKESGWLELRTFSGMTVAQGAAVGGGSMIYANVSVEPPSHVFDHGWPSEINYAELKPYLDRVAQFMNVQRVPKGQWTSRMKLMHDAAKVNNLEGRFQQLDLAVSFNPDWTYEKDFDKGERDVIYKKNQHGALQGTCIHLGNCDIGCDVYAKNTLDKNYLYVAENKFGVNIRPLQIVNKIEPVDERNYLVSFEDLESGDRVMRQEMAPIVVIAAGSLGSTELLLRAKDMYRTLPNVSNFLGHKWSCNGDFLTPAFYPNRNIDTTIGPTIGAAIDFHDESLGKKSFWIQDGGFPNLAVNYLRQVTSDPSISFKAKLVLEMVQKFLNKAEPLTAIMPWFAQGIDSGDGKLSLVPVSQFSNKLKLGLDWNIERSRALIDVIVKTHVRLSESTGGMPLVPPTWSLFSDLITPHPLGGCNMGSSPENGVVNHRGQVFGYENLYVVDGSIIPCPLGVNPSRTIAALSERIASLIIGAS